ncbi:MAG TPA: 2-amino-4-hydroxy-6-hydroxymethyldihydropteridine diphosphokinase [Gammaproteobacteria bacterium]|nr:2-amino-4-hydroxy-6-hydroxymethyldihydropteridine diphosphokinase [Gammaproteobacteria bacterium]
MTEVTAFIGLGSNLDDPGAQVCKALRELDEIPHTRVSAVSPLYRSAPMGPQNQPDYVNAVAQLQTALGAEQLLDALQAIEQAHDRRRGEHWGPRTLDLDILLFGDSTLQTDRLSVPHPGIAQRNFVLYPLADIDATLAIPGAGSVQSLLAQCPQDGLVRMDRVA